MRPTSLVLLAATLGALLSACVTTREPAPAGPISWTELPGWAQERHGEAWVGLKLSCTRLATDPAWQSVCEDAALFDTLDDDTARAFFETRFVPRVVTPAGEAVEGLITGYYEPLLMGSLARNERFRHPLYGTPEDLVVIDLGEVYPALRGRPVRGRVAGRRVVPYFSRAEIETAGAISAPVLAWVDDPVALFFLHVQGSGRVRLPNGELRYVGYADQNGHPYVSIGRRLIELGQLTPEAVSLQSIRSWLKANPGRASEILRSNPSYIFFRWRADESAVGSFGVPLVAERAAAVDPAHIPLGSPLFIATDLPGSPARPYRRLLFAHDTGGAIKGAARVDVFFGHGEYAEAVAGMMKQRGRVYVLVPAERSRPARVPHPGQSASTSAANR